MPISGHRFSDTIMLYLLGIDQVYGFGSSRFKVILI